MPLSQLRKESKYKINNRYKVLLPSQCRSRSFGKNLADSMPHYNNDGESQCRSRSFGKNQAYFYKQLNIYIMSQCRSRSFGKNRDGKKIIEL